MRMDYHFKLSPAAQLILRMFFEAEGKGLSANDLATGFHYLYPMKDGFAAAFKTYSLKFNSVINSEEKSLLEREISGLEYVGLIEKVRATKTGSTYKYKLTDEGKRIAQAISDNRRLFFRPRTAAQTTVFIACAFGKSEIDELCDRHLITACAKLGYKPVRVDRTEPERTITELIMEEITQAAAMLADLTYARPSVYFEIGYAHGLGIPIVLTCRSDHYRATQDEQRVHFDLEQYKISFWQLDDSGKFNWDSESLEPGNRLAEIIPMRE